MYPQAMALCPQALVSGHLALDSGHVSAESLISRPRGWCVVVCELHLSDQWERHFSPQVTFIGCLDIVDELLLVRGVFQTSCA